MPFAEQAIVPDRKITHYLLNPDHPEGGSKARYFLNCGYSMDDVDRFRQDLLRLGQTSEMEETATEFGVEYAGSGTVLAPNGRPVRVRTAWILVGGNPPPRLITANPDD